jgi:hypothetical protein
VADWTTLPASRPLASWAPAQIRAAFEHSLGQRDGQAGAHCIHELWMRGARAAEVEPALERLWQRAATTVPDWLPMRYFETLGLLYEIAGGFRAQARGSNHVYLVLLDYRDGRGDPYGIYVGMSHYSPSQRFDQHKAGIRAAGSVLRRGLEVVLGPVLHLQSVARAEAARIEGELAVALRAAGLTVMGGH